MKDPRVVTYQEDFVNIRFRILYATSDSKIIFVKLGIDWVSTMSNY